MNRRYSQSVLKIWGLAGCVVALVVVIALITASVHNGHINSQNHKIQTRQHFWYVVAGQETPTAPTVDNKLALDLREVIRSAHSDKAINDFRGDSNSYGGISGVIGVDPFSGAGCSECGPLSPYMRAGLKQVKAGNVSSVINSDKPAKTNDPSKWVLLIFIWFFSIIPLLLFPRWKIRNRMKSMPTDQRQLLEKTNNALHELDAGDPRYDELILLRNNLDKALLERADAGKNAISDRQLANLVTDLKTNLVAIEEGNKVFDD